MQALHGTKSFGFIPKTYILPGEISVLKDEMRKDKNQLWIMKPTGLSQGKGIFVTDDLNDIPEKQPYVCQ